ncbi:MAG: MoxR family ATPase [Candidatus Synoicihabitans palmerolidicus]|nr:MoxR family ATPase [Candidatus Synoicihabitans palmerolidicus]
MSDFVFSPAMTEAKQAVDKLRANMRRTIKGKDDVIERTIVCLLARGHLLIEDLPGVGKTTLAYSLACAFSRIQFTSDLLPSDVTGVAIYDANTKEFVFKKGPVFASIVLADEINRATPKTQSSLLEVMDRSNVTIDGEAHTVGSPFMVFATQNPVDYEGTFPLPESQMDRFLMRIHMGYHTGVDEMDILRSAQTNYDAISLDPVLTRTEVAHLQEITAQVFVEDSVLEFVLKIVNATRTEAEFKAGVRVRGGLDLKHAAQAQALAWGRAFVIPEDVTALVVPVLGHRLGLARPSSDALKERRAVTAALKRIVESLPSP